MLEDRFAQHDKEFVDKYHNPNADYIMSQRDYTMRPFADGDSGPITITLPPVSEAKGRWYTIVARDADAVNTITVTDRDDSECWQGDYILDAKCDWIRAYSDGLCWFIDQNNEPADNPNDEYAPYEV